MYIHSFEMTEMILIISPFRFYDHFFSSPRSVINTKIIKIVNTEHLMDCYEHTVVSNEFTILVI